MNEAQQEALARVQAMTPDDRRGFLAYLAGREPVALMHRLDQYEADTAGSRS